MYPELSRRTRPFRPGSAWPPPTAGRPTPIRIRQALQAVAAIGNVPNRVSGAATIELLLAAVHDLRARLWSCAMTSMGGVGRSDITVIRRMADIADVIRTARSRTAFRQEILGYLRGSVGCDAGTLMSCSPDGQMIVGGLDDNEKLVAGNLQRWMSDVPVLQVRACFERTQSDRHLFSVAYRSRASMYVEHLIPLRTREFITRLWLGPSGIFGINLALRGRVGRFRERDIALVDALLPVIAAGETFHGSSAEPASVESGYLFDQALSQREVDVALFVQRGLRNKEIAALLGLSANRVRNLLASVFRKVGASTRAELSYLLSRSAAQIDGSAMAPRQTSVAWVKVHEAMAKGQGTGK